MRTDRREFLRTTAITGAFFAGQSIFRPLVTWADVKGSEIALNKDAYPANRHIVYDDGKEYMAFSTAYPYRDYMCKPGPADAATWVMIDLGKKTTIDNVKLYPAIENGWGFWTDHFPLRFKIEVSDDSDFKTSALVADHTGKNFNPELLRIWSFPSAESGRFVRLTVIARAGDRFRLSKIGVFSGNLDVAVGCTVTADTVYGNLDGPQKISQLTRPYRPMGEGVITDHPENLIPLAKWKPPVCKVKVPLGGVTLNGGVFQTVMENNIAYLLQTDNLDHHLHPFRERAGKPVIADAKPQVRCWETYLTNSSAGRFLMGAGNTLRWIDHPELRARMNALVDGIAECRRDGGYILAYEPETAFDCERGAYDRAWLTHGLIEAGYAGNSRAFKLLRGQHDWFNKWSFLPKLLRGAGQGGQGLIASTRLYSTPVGRPEDIHVIQRYFQENFWMRQLSELKPEAIWLYPYDRPHCYLITNLEAYMDLYMATGESKYLDAAKGGRDMFQDHWQHIGGSIAICEFEDYAPGSYKLTARAGEFCGSVFWIKLNQRFHLLYPTEERYVTEIEKSIYNIGLANQVGDKGIIYTTRLIERKNGGLNTNTCCEGQGSRLFSSLPEYIYSISADGIFINLYEPSTIAWSHNKRQLQLKMETSFPMQNDVSLTFSGGRLIDNTIYVRVPSWAASPMEIRVNNSVVAVGKAGIYVAIHRKWTDGDVLSFTLPISFKLSKYTGSDFPDQPLYALEYGPILMAATGPKKLQVKLKTGWTDKDLFSKLSPAKSNPLHFSLSESDLEFIPYWQVGQGQHFTCFTRIES